MNRGLAYLSYAILCLGLAGCPGPDESPDARPTSTQDAGPEQAPDVGPDTSDVSPDQAPDVGPDAPTPPSKVIVGENTPPCLARLFRACDDASTASCQSRMTSDDAGGSGYRRATCFDNGVKVRYARQSARDQTDVINADGTLCYSQSIESHFEYHWRDPQGNVVAIGRVRFGDGGTEYHVTCTGESSKTYPITHAGIQAFPTLRTCSDGPCDW